MYRIQRFGVIRTATVVAVLYALIVAIIIVPFIIIAGLLGASAADGSGILAGVGLAVAVVIGLLVAAFYAAIGWIFTALACLLYNLAARWVGGIEVAVEAVPVTPPPAVPTTGWGAPPANPPG
jgi:hypothetical protein